MPVQTMSGPPRRIDAVATMRFIHIALLVATCIYAGMGEFLAPRQPRDPGALQVVLLFIAIADVGVALLVRARMVAPATADLMRRPDDSAAWNRWRAGHLFTLVMLETVVLFGFVLRMLGGTFRQAALFYGIGLVLLLIFTPRRPGA